LGCDSDKEMNHLMD